MVFILCTVPALSGVELQEDTEAVAQLGVVLSDGIVPEQHQAREELGTADPATVHQLGQALGHLRAQLSVLTQTDKERLSIDPFHGEKTTKSE